jgi:hypothetical protein
MPVQEKYGEGMVTGKEVNERLLFWILMVTSSCWLKISVRDPSNRQELPKLYRGARTKRKIKHGKERNLLVDESANLGQQG